MSLGSMVRQRRLEMKLTQEQVENQGGGSREWLSLVENDKVKQPSWDLLRDLARVLNFDATELLREAGYSLNVPGISDDEARVILDELAEMEIAVARIRKRLLELTQSKKESAGEDARGTTRKLVAAPRPGRRGALAGAR